MKKCYHLEKKCYHLEKKLKSPKNDYIDHFVIICKIKHFVLFISLPIFNNLKNKEIRQRLPNKQEK